MAYAAGTGNTADLRAWGQGAAERKEAAATQALAAAREERAAAAESVRRVHDTFISASSGSGGNARGAGRAEPLVVPDPDDIVGADNDGASRGSRPNAAPSRGREGSGAGSDALAASGVRSSGSGGERGRRPTWVDRSGVPLAATQVPGMSAGVRPPSPGPAPGDASEPVLDTHLMVHPTLVEQPLTSASGLGTRRAGPSAGGPANPAQGASQPERPAPDSAPDHMPNRSGEDAIGTGQGGKGTPEDGNEVKDSAEPEDPAVDADAAADRLEEAEDGAGTAAVGMYAQGGGYEEAQDAHAGALVRAPELSVVAAPARRLSFGTARTPRSRSGTDGAKDGNPGQGPSPDPYALDNRDSGAQRSGDENVALDPNSMAESGETPGCGLGSAGKAEPMRMEVDDTEGNAGGDAPEGLGKALPRGFMHNAQPGTLDDEGGELAGMM